MIGEWNQLSRSALAALAGAAFLLPGPLEAQCVGETTDGETTQFLAHRYVKRKSLNNVESQAGTIVIGPYRENWDTEVLSTAYRDQTVTHSGAASAQNAASYVTFNDTPSSDGVGTYSNVNSHQASCDVYPYTTNIGLSSDSQAVEAPTIGNMPFSSALWYFGPGTPGAVPVNVGHYSGSYAYQYANLTYNTNCLSNDVCDGAPTWGEIDPEGAISVSSSGVLESTGGHDACSRDSAVTATLDGWQVVSEPIFVNRPVGVRRASNQSVRTTVWRDGYRTIHPWEVYDTCGQKIPSTALNETFGSFSKPGVVSGWPDPPESNSSGYGAASNEYWEDSIAATSNTWDPDPVYTGSAPPYTYSTLIVKTDDQKWYIGTTARGSGIKIFDGSAEWYQGHGHSEE